MKKMQSNTKSISQSAFTLVELAIVIVIIGLLVGGVMQGAELINQSKIRSQIKQFEEYNAAIVIFKDKYSFLPGDLPVNNAALFGLNQWCSGTTGNGKIDDFSNPTPAYAWCEPKVFFIHLSSKGMIKDRLSYVPASFSVGDAFPLDKIGVGGLMPVTLNDGALYYFMGPTRKNDTTNSSGFSYISETPSLTPDQAFAIDSKLDDGVPSSGTVRSVLASSGLPNDTNLNSCNGASTSVYNLSNGNNLCRIIVASVIK